MTDRAPMRVGVGLPAAVPGVGPDQILSWARWAESAGFSSLAALDRVVYANHEPLLTLAAAAAVTERITLATHVLLGATREPALLAKQAATLHSLSRGRFTLGLGVGVRPADYAATGTAFAGRGRRLDGVVDALRHTWASAGTVGTIGPVAPDGRPGLVLGGRSPRALDRAARLGDGWVAGSIAFFAEGAAVVREAWRRHGRDGDPRLLAVGYVALGVDGPAQAQHHLPEYYGVTEEAAASLSSTALTSPRAVREAVQRLAGEGCDELVLYPCGADPDQVGLLADALR